MVKWLPLKRVLALFSAKYADSVALDRSVILHRKGAYREAYALLRGVLDRHPDWRVGDAYVICANLELLVNDDTSKAGELLDTGLRLGCRDLATYYSVSGYVFCQIGEWDRGIRELEKAVDAEPSIYNLSVLGTELSLGGDTRAEDIWARVLRQEPLHCQAHIYLGFLAARTGNHEEALCLARRADELHPDARDFLHIANLYHEIGEHQIALDKYAEADRRGCELNGPAYAAMAACHFELGAAREGCRCLEEARRRSPNSTFVKKTWDFYRDKCPQD